jgi:hypothetical protein
VSPVSNEPRERKRSGGAAGASAPPAASVPRGTWRRAGAQVRTRKLALKRYCPVCRSGPGELCRSVGKSNPRAGDPRHSCHAARYG